MKKKQKERLKTDPFVHFMQQALAFVKSHRRLLLIGTGAAALVVLILLAVFFFHSLSASSENRLYAEAFRIHHDEKKSVEEKIVALQGMEFKKGISAAGHLFLAALHYQKGDTLKAEAVLAAMPRSRVALINDEKQILFARVLNSGGKKAEARSVLERLLADKKTTIGKELVLMQLAKQHIQEKHNEEAAALLKRILAEYGDSLSAMEARELLATIEGSATR